MKRTAITLAALAALSAPLPAMAEEVPPPAPTCDTGYPEGVDEDTADRLEAQVFTLQMKLEDKRVRLQMKKDIIQDLRRQLRQARRH